jgi:multisubunit Na+/H+ antiporter MnhB subunit
MYHVGGKTGIPGAVVVSTTGVGSGLAFTGFPAVGLAIVALVAIICGAILLRVAMVRRGSDDELVP